MTSEKHDVQYTLRITFPNSPRYQVLQGDYSTSHSHLPPPAGWREALLLDKLYQEPNKLYVAIVSGLFVLFITVVKAKASKKKKKKDSRNRSDKCASGIGSHRQPFRELPRAWGRSPLIGRGFPDSCDAGEGTSPGCSCKQLLSVFRALMDTRNARQCSPRNSHGIRIPSSCAS